MKNIKYIFTSLVLLLLVMGCKDNSDFPKIRNEALTNLQRGGFIQFKDVRQSMTLAGDNPNSAVFTAEIEDPNGTAAIYRVGLITSTDTVTVAEINSFPAELTINASDIQTILGRNLEFGESFDFWSEVVTESGVTYTGSTPGDPNTGWQSENGVVTQTGGLTRFEITQPANTGLKQAFVFSLLIVCPNPPNASSYPGTYNIVTGTTWFNEGGTVDVVAGPGDNQITIQGIELRSGGGRSGSADVVVTLNEDQTVDFADALGTFANTAFGQLRMSQVGGTNRTVECANNRIALTYRMFIPDGRAYGARELVIEKQ